PVGALIASRRPRNPIGWIMLAIGLVSAIGGVFDESARQLYAPRLDLGAGLFLVGDALSRLVLLLVGLLLLLFPDGRLPSRRWRSVVIAGATAWGLSVITEVFVPVPLADFAMISPPQNPFGIASLNDFSPGPAIGVSIFIVFFASVFLSIVSVAFRFHRAGPELRLQLKWVGLAASLLVAAIVGGNVFVATAQSWSGWAPLPFSVVQLVAFLATNLAIAVAILRHRLFDIDLVISRTVAYGVLAGVITVFYIVVVAGVGGILAAGSASRLLLAVVATAFVAVAFQPLRTRLERLANRLVYGVHAVPYEVLADFTTRLDGRQDSLQMLPVMAKMLAQGTGSDAATVWLHENGRDVAASSFPEHQQVTPDTATRSVLLQHAGANLGRLAVVRKSGEALSPTEERLMDGLASQAGLVLHSAGLQDQLSRRMVELRQSRHRLVAAQDEARRRLERDLHDGAQQNLVSLRMKLGLAASVARERPGSLEPLLQEMQSELGAALDSLRNLARGVYPPLLEAEGLKAALRARARQVPISIDVQCGSERYPRELEGAVYFCCSEALQNLSKHSRATRGSVRVWCDEGRLAFEVSDNGRGLDPTRAKSGGGLQNIRDRLDVLGGVMEVSSTPGTGARVAGWVPLSTSPKAYSG
ncbi:MAG TPA: histidine kinase, partial [Candidatus Dormibacteraeota bacterium]|nr:histidine kinase [Candidatus Dormibacteraeota bacterium]